jgi:hypothetical protein
MTHFKYLLTILVFIFYAHAYSQDNTFSKSDFTPPVDIPIYLSGTFGELRGNHFHTGIDIKTQGIIGKSILAIDDGWVSRIKVSTSGYGKALYITHPNGYLSVYGHLQMFNDTIQKVVVENQYEKESFEIQLFFEKNELPVKKGEIVAMSGNTGSSMGPHLHFEIRDLRSQNPLNPLLFNSIKINDYYRPKIKLLAIYPVNKSSIIDGKNDTVYFDISGWGENHKLKDNPTIKVSGSISFGIATYDLMNDIPNKNGVYSGKVYVDDNKVFDIKMDRLSFKTGRYINSLIDYSYYKKSKTRLIRTQVDTNNMFKNYVNVINNGIITIDDTLSHNIRFEISDAYDNFSSLNFSLVGIETSKEIKNEYKKKDGILFRYDNENNISEDGIIAEFPVNTFYQSFYFDYKKMKQDSTTYSSIYKLHNSFTPVHKYYDLRISFDSISDSLLSKAYIAYSEDGSDYYYSGGIIDGKALKGKFRKLGYYKVMVDTIPPKISEGNFKEGIIVTNLGKLSIKISDPDSGIKSYRGYLNDNWILMEYDPKNELLVYNFDNNIGKGPSNFRLEVIDNSDNFNNYECSFIN